MGLDNSLIINELFSSILAGSALLLQSRKFIVRILVLGDASLGVLEENTTSLKNLCQQVEYDHVKTVSKR